jgi:hypothetical protein
MPTWVLVVISITNDMSAMFTSFDKVCTFLERPWPQQPACTCGISPLTVDNDSECNVTASLQMPERLLAIALPQVHTSSTPELWNMQKCLAVAAAQSAVCICGAVLFLVRLQAPVVP